LSSYLSKVVKDTTYIRPHDEPCKRPHLARVQVSTSDLSGVHQFGEALEVKFWIRHPQPMVRGCFCFQIINQFQQAVVHAFAYHPEYLFGTVTGTSILLCHFPKLQLNVGAYYLRTWLQEPPGGEIYETLDGICPFEVARLDQAVYWGWRPEVCTYYENY